jgi:hypothetical protein
LLTLHTPTREQLRAASSAPDPDSETLHEYRWIVDRFAITHLHEWTTPSLHREYSWKQGTRPPPCAESLMSDRVVVDRDLNDEIAHRAVTANSATLIGAPAGLSTTLLAKLRSSAIEFLRASRPREAAALFEFAISESPRDAELVNNLGFRLIPLDPRRALAKLEEANRLGYPISEINLYNRALRRLLMGEYQTALDMIQSFWDQAQGEPAFLWRPDAQGLQLRSVQDSRDELAYLARRAASFLGEDTVSEHWARLADNQNHRK